MVGVGNCIYRWSFLNIVGCNMHVHTGVKTWYNLIEKSDFRTLLNFIKRIWSWRLNSIEHAIFFINWLPNVGSIVSCVALSVLSELYIYEVGIILGFLELIDTPFSLSSFHFSWIPFKFLLLTKDSKPKLMIKRCLRSLVILLHLSPELWNFFLITLAKWTFIWVA